MAQDQNTLAALAQEHLGEGPPFITNLTADVSKVGRCFRQHIEHSRQAVLRSHPWGFATDRASLTLKAITNAVNNGAGLIRLTVPGHLFVTGDFVTVMGVQGTLEANAQWTITSINANTIDLQGSTFTNAYVGGGLVGLAPVWGYDFKFPKPSTWLRVGRLEEDPEFAVEGQFIVTDSSSIKVRFIKDITTYSEWDALAFQALALHLAFTACYAITQSNKLKEELLDLFTTVVKKARHVDSTENSRRELKATLWVDSHEAPWSRQFVRDPMTS